jgi:hypothetical protein
MKQGSHLVLGSTLLGGMLAGVSALAVAAPVPKPKPVSPFETTVRPVLASRCFQCHGPQAQLGGLRLDSRAAALKGGQSGPSLVPGHPERSLLIQAVHYDGKLKMPPPGKLAAAEIRILTDWIRQGAPWEGKSDKVKGKGGVTAGPNAQHPAPDTLGPLWAFQPLVKPKVPAVKAKGWVKTPVDAFVLAELERRGMKPSPYADRRTLIRRVSLDLIGLPPTPAEVEAFVNDRSPNAYEKVVDRLLASPHFGERLALHWLDQARYADSDGYHDDTDRTQWGYRDYVIQSFNEDKPFNQFTVEQIAGDLLVREELKKRGEEQMASSMWNTFPISSPKLTPELQEILVASAFNRSGPTTSEGGAIPEEVLNAYAVDRVNTTANVWLGLTLQCTQCHDHKYDPLTARDFYQLASYFNQVPEQALYRGADAPPTMLYPTPEQQKRLDELASQIAALEQDVKPRPDAPDVKAEQARVAEVKKKLDAARAARTGVLKNSTLRVMVDVPQRRPTHLLHRGDYRSPGEEVQPAIPAVFGKLPADAPANRLALARWLVDPKQPLTPRVTVNRFWQLLFGMGIVKTSEDFGTRGEKPSHPELLDWLAATFVSGEGRGESGEGRNTALSPLSSSLSPSGLAWSPKRLLKLLVMSATYQQSSRLTPELRVKDPENRLLARGPRFRLSAELIRDNALAISGLLVRKIGGPSIKPYQPGDLWRELSSGDQAAKSYIQDHGPELYRRGLYVFWKRSILFPAFAVFDASKRETCVLRRPITNTPLQAFVTLNDTTYVEAARVFAQRVLKQGGPTLNSRLDYALRLALGRPITAGERTALTRVYQTTLEQYRANPAAALQLVSVGESIRPQDLDVPEHAAWTCVCNTLLNLDETITKE